MKHYKLCLIILYIVLYGCATQNTPSPHDISLKKDKDTIHLKWLNSKLSASNIGSFVPTLDSDNSIYAIDSSGYIIKIDSTDGSIIDKFNINKEVVSGMALSSDMLYITTSSAKLLAISKFKHQIEWEVQLSTLAIEPPQYSQNKVVVKTNDAVVSCYDAKNGNLIWVFQRPSPILTLHNTNTMELNTGGDVMLLGENNGKVALINLNTGIALFELAISIPNGATDIDKISDITSRPVLSDKTICANTYNGKLSCLNAVNGLLLWSQPFSSYTQIITDKQYLYAINNEGVVFAFDINTGVRVWANYELQYRTLYSPITLGDFVVMGDIEGHIYTIDKYSGKLVDMIETSLKGGLSYPIANNYRVVYQAGNGNIGAIYLY
jgi:outer membrane protein assembly factor BamB